MVAHRHGHIGFETPRDVSDPLVGSTIAEIIQPRGHGSSRNHIVWHPLNVLRIIFAVLMVGMIITGLTTRARPQTARQWTLVWVVVLFLTWALLGFGWLRA